MATSVWKVNALEYLEAPAASALVYHDFYPQGRQSGIEIIQHDARVAANGDLRLGVWGYPTVGERKASPRKRTVTVAASYPEQGVDYTVRVAAEGKSLRIVVDLAQPLPGEARGAAFNLDLFAPAYWGKTYHLGGRSGIFPRQDNGIVEALPEGGRRPVPLATGAVLSIAPEDPERAMTIERIGGEIELIEGDWFQVRAAVPEGATREAVELVITPNQIQGWQRKPVIGVSQVGYHPGQEKRAVIELDPRTAEPGEATLVRIAADGTVSDVLSAPLVPWGSFLRYQYAVFDFTSVKEPGTYLLRYQEEQTLPFRIGADVYQRGVWEPTLETYLPVQMCHVHVHDDGLVWHGACHLDDALQAPAPLVHIDGYEQGPETETPFHANEHIPGLDRGGWHDAGDDDLAAGAQAETTLLLALARETFGLDTDRTTVQREERMVRLHRPDGVPDVIQQVIHGVENLLTGYRAAGHSFSGIIHASQAQRISGDWASVSDGLIYDAWLGENEVLDRRSGRQDDRWAFTSRDTALEYKVAQSLAAASRVLRGYEDALAQECLETAVKAWEYEQSHEPVRQHSAYVPRDRMAQEIQATAELLITTGEDRYRQRLIALQPMIVGDIAGDVRGVHTTAWVVARALPSMKDEAFALAVRQAVEHHRQVVEDEIGKTPYRIPWHPHIWGVGWDVQRFGYEQYFLVKAFPDLFGRELVLSVVNYVLGCHPGSNISFACGVGSHTLTCEYGYLRAHWGYIPGAVVSGTALIRPDFPELKDNFPFLWQQSEDVIAGAASYIFCILAAEELLNG
jgi:endoglucanase